MEALALTHDRGRRASVVECGPAGPLWEWAWDAKRPGHIDPLGLDMRWVESAAAAGALQNLAEIVAEAKSNDDSTRFWRPTSQPFLTSL